MKKAMPFFLLCFTALLFSSSTEAQLWKKIKNEVKNRAQNNVVNKAGNTTDKVIDKTADAATGHGSGSGSSGSSEESHTGAPASATTVRSAPSVSYKSYDFVAGDKIIFQPDLSKEPDAELPARFILNGGNAEIQTYEGEKILHLDQGGDATVSPLMTSDTYLPEQFTLEFDMMYENDASYFHYANDFLVQFRNRGDMDYGSRALYQFNIVSNTKCIFGDKNARQQAFPEALGESMSTNNTWHHVAIYIHKNIGKVYVDAYRVAASNTLPTGANKVNLRTDVHYGFKIKNFRLAAGGDDKYQQIVTDGKFITHGILFDVNKSTIKPESMGTLNEIAKLMKDHSDLSFEIDGHTDSDGSADANLKLSQARAEAVKSKLVDMGISDSRLSTQGFGAAKPIDTNDTAEGKANNRRVEFIKK